MMQYPSNLNQHGDFMKFLALFLMITTTQAFASEICKYEETWQFAEAHKELGKSGNHSSFSAIEKKMIHKAVSNQEWLGKLTEKEALDLFGDFHGGREPGSNAGSITYFKVDGKKIALVTYYPGDNEYGAFFEVTGPRFRMLAQVGDSFIECK